MTDKPTLPPPSEPFPGSKTPGWNDPPTLPYNSSSGSNSSGRTRLNLNKRVAFPLQGIGADVSAVTKPTAVVPPNISMSKFTQHPIAVVHPLCPPTSNIVPPPLSVSSIPTSIIALPEDSLNTSMRVLREQAKLLQEIQSRRDEIERRLGLIEQLWQSNNMSAPVQEKIYRMAKAISEKQFNDAMEVYTSLVTNHTNECTAFSAALRQVVLSLQCTSRSDETISESNSSNIPSMYVTAMPRQTSTNDAPTATIERTDDQPAGSSSVQHI